MSGLQRVRGEDLIFGWGRERLPGLPDYLSPVHYLRLQEDGLEGLETFSRAGLPSGRMVGGFQDQDLPGPASGPIALELLMQPDAHLLEMFEHFAGGDLTLNEPVVGEVWETIFGYDTAQQEIRARRAISGHSLRSRQSYMIGLEEMAMTIKGDAPVTMMVKGIKGQGGHMGPPEAAASNTGGFFGPCVRGIPRADRDPGDIWVWCTGTSPLRFAAGYFETDTPTLPGAPAKTFGIDYGISGEGRFFNLRDHTGLDMGTIGRNATHEPVEIAFVGQPEDHDGAISVGDAWRYRLSPFPIVPTYTPDTQILTYANFLLEWRRSGSGDSFEKIDSDEVTVSIKRELSTSRRGNYLGRMGLAKNPTYEISFPHDYTEETFRDFERQQIPVEIRASLTGAQIGSDPALDHRYLIELTCPKVQLKAPVDLKTGVLGVAASGMARPGDSLEPPMTVRVVHTEPFAAWTPPA